MAYPTMEQVKAADREQLCSWHRFLPSPGSDVIDTNPSLEVGMAAIAAEKTIMDRIHERFKAAGGFTVGISKRVGWSR